MTFLRTIRLGRPQRVLHPLPPIAIHPVRRFVRITSFFLGVVLHIYVFDILMNRSPFTRWWAQRSGLRRYCEMARQFRGLALEMGGVQIKLGQFLSSRADILPIEVRRELSDLQDEVTPVPAPYILEVLMAELGAAPEQVFASFDMQPVAAASLGQVHYALLQDGREAAVKVQRPRISEIIEVDLSAVRWVIRLVKNYPPIRRRANLDSLFEEFGRVLLQELDYLQEAENAEIFRRNFAGVVGVYVPEPYRELTTRRVLVMERIGGIKLSDLAGIEAAGVNRVELADRLTRAYLKQIYLDGVFHADPHPGNLFVRIDPERPMVPVTPVNGNGAHPDPLPGPRVQQGVPFTLILIDFGMVGRLQPHLMEALRKGVVGLATNDPERMVQALDQMGVILPNADRRPIVQGLRTLMRYSYNRSVRELSSIDVDRLFDEVKELVYELPFQMPQDLIYLGRAVSMISGLATELYPDINLFEMIQPFAQQLVEREQRQGDWFERLQREFVELGQLMARLPRQMDAYYQAANNGELSTRADFSRLERGVRRVENATNRLAGGIVAASLFLGGAQLRSAGREKDADWAWRAATAAALWSIWPRSER